MYINKIDDLLSQLLDDFYIKVITSSKFVNLTKETNLLRYQKDINDLMSSYTESIDLKDIRTITTSNTNINFIIETFKRYIAYEIYITLGFFYTGNLATFDNNIVEITNNQSDYQYKIVNFYTSDSTANVIKFTDLAKKIQLIVSLDPKKLASFSMKEEYHQAFEFLNNVGKDFVDSNFKLKILKNNTKLQCHNIIKTILFVLLYQKIEKLDIVRMIESSDLEKGEYIFIDVVVPTKKYIDLVDVESVLSQKEIDNGIAYNIWDLIKKSNEILNAGGLSPDEKILAILNRKLIVPIVEDFILYHKDSERYDKFSEEKIKKKKEDTKLKYIINKIDTFSEYYSENIKKNKIMLDKIKNLLYPPLSEKLAILVNDTEEVKIINKLVLFGSRSLESNELYHDLLAYRKYPYINFRDFDRVGFQLLCDNTIDVIRMTSFNEKLLRSNNKLQLRIGSQDQVLHIVGLAIPTNVSSIECIKMKNIFNIKSLHNKNDKSVNGYDNFIKFILQTIIDHMNHKSSIYWLFNMSQDIIKLKTYEQIEKLSPNEYCKLMVASLYDVIIDNIVFKIKTIFEKMKSVPVQYAHSIIDYFNKKLLDIPENSEARHTLEKLIYSYFYEKVDTLYDTRDDIMYGLSGDIIKLPSYVSPPEEKLLSYTVEDPSFLDLSLEKTQKDLKVIQKTNVTNFICQHFISWEQIMRKKKLSITEYTELLNEFIQRYLLETFDHEFVCKSCGSELNIKNYVTSGVYDEHQHFIAAGIPLMIPLEESPEYEKYKNTIINIGRLIEKIAMNNNISTFTGASPTVKWARKTLTKDVIDLIITHNEMLSKVERKQSGKNYGINRDLSKLFIFTLDDNIFKFSIKEKDYYKHIKHNNIIIYIIILMILELNDNHITFMTGYKKLCNFMTFEKFNHIIFDKINIISNDHQDTQLLIDYPVLCYILYIISCSLVKYHTWYSDSNENDQKVKNVKFNAYEQKIILHTIVDVLNSVLEMYKLDKNNHLYKLIFIKFMNKLDTTFSNKDVLERLKNRDTLSSISGKNFASSSKYAPILLEEMNEFNNLGYEMYHLFKMRITKKSPPVIKQIAPFPIKNTNITNCEDGSIHEWKPSEKTIKCSNCGVIGSEIKFDDNQSQLIYNNAKYKYLYKLGQKYCVSGEFHVLEILNEKMQCTKCKYILGSKLTDTQKDQLEKSLDKNSESKAIIGSMYKHLDKYQQKIEKYYTKVIDYLKSNYGESKSHKEDYYQFIDTFVSLIQSITGDHVPIKGEIHQLRENVYIIDHDHMGFPLDNPIKIPDQTNKIFYKNNHPFFKTDVLYYINYKSGKTDVFYDLKTFILLGYKEQNKDYVSLKKPDKKIKLELSILNKIKYLGHTSNYINIAEMEKELLEQYSKTDKEVLLKEIVSRIGRERIYNLRSIINQFQIYINMIKNSVTQQKEEEIIYFDINDYMNKLKHVTVYDPQHKHKIFKLWQTVTDQISFKTLENKTINFDVNETSVSIEEFHKYDYHGNLLLFYIINEFSKLLNYNQNKIIKQHLATFLIDFINNVFREYNTDHLMKLLDIRRFKYLLDSRKYSIVLEKMNYDSEEYSAGIYGEYKDPSEEITKEELRENAEIKEEAEALDIEDDELDYEDIYDANYSNWQPSRSYAYNY